MTGNQKGKNCWLETGYVIFAQEGPGNLTIKRISDEIGKSRASFYHYFGDLEVFLEELFALHYIRIKEGVDAVSKYVNAMFPDLYLALENYPNEILFQQQLLRNRHISVYNKLFDKTYAVLAEGVLLNLFIDQFNLNYHRKEVQELYFNFYENWLSRLNPNNLSFASMQKHAKEILRVVMGKINLSHLKVLDNL